MPLTFAGDAWAPFAELSGVALEVDIACEHAGGPVRFREDLLFTHRGLSGPAVLQISTFWRHGVALEIDLVPAADLHAELKHRKDSSRQNLSQVLAAHLPKRLAVAWQGARREGRRAHRGVAGPSAGGAWPRASSDGA